MDRHDARTEEQWDRVSSTPEDKRTERSTVYRLTPIEENALNGQVQRM